MLRYVMSHVVSKQEVQKKMNGTVLAPHTLSNLKIGTCKKKIFAYLAGAALQGAASLDDSLVSSRLCCGTVFSGIPL